MSKRPTTSGKDPAVATSIRMLADCVGRGPSTVRKWFSRRDWCLPCRAPWVVEDVQKWMAVHLRKKDPAQRYHDAQKGVGVVSLTDLEKARTENYQEAAAIRRLKRLQVEGQLHDVAECDARRRRQMYHLRNLLLRVPRSMAPELTGKGRGEIEQRLNAEMRRILLDLSEGRDG